MASPPVFTVSFRVDVPIVVDKGNETVWLSYTHFIEDLRSRLRSEGRYSHHRPVLPLQSDPSTWFHIILQTTSHMNGITLRIRRNNLYLDGYQMENSEQWLEFGLNNDRHLIPGSTFLGFRGGYPDLQQKAGPSGENLLGQNQLITAVNLLATSTNSQARAKSLITIIRMTSESIRFEAISNHISTRFSRALPPEIGALVNCWGDLSDALLWDDADPVDGFRRLPQGNETNIRNIAQAADVIGILLGLDICRAPRRVPRMVEAAGRLGQGTQGRPLVEVFSVVSKNNTGGKLYSIITVTDGVRCQYIYDPTRDEGDSGLLNGPAGCISAYGSFVIDMTLMDDIKGQISWNVYDINNRYDTLLQEDVNGSVTVDDAVEVILSNGDGNDPAYIYDTLLPEDVNGSVTVNYAVFRDAVQATVEVILSNGDGNDLAYVYGQITAGNGNITIESTLFQKTLDENKRVSPGARIPLSRSVVAVPLNSSLIVGADLFVHNGYKPESEREIANGNAEFPAQCSGSSEEDISGKYGRIRVTVTWTVYI